MLYETIFELNTDQSLENLSYFVDSPVALTENIVELSVLLSEMQKHDINNLDDAVQCFIYGYFRLDTEESESITTFKAVHTDKAININESTNTILILDQLKYLYDLVCNSIQEHGMGLRFEIISFIKRTKIPTHIGFFYLLSFFEASKLSKNPIDSLQEDFVLRCIQGVDSYSNSEQVYSCSMLFINGDNKYYQDGLVEVDHIGSYSNEIIKLALYTSIFQREIGFNEESPMEFFEAIGCHENQVVCDLVKAELKEVKVLDQKNNEYMIYALSLTPSIEKVVLEDMLYVLFQMVKCMVAKHGFLFTNNQISLNNIKRNNQVFYDVMHKMEHLIKSGLVIITNKEIADILVNYQR